MFCDKQAYFIVQERHGTRKVSVVAVGRAISNTYSEYVSVSLFINHAKHIVILYLLSVACLAVPCSVTLSYKRHDI
jgi:hypothetical protein